MFDDDKDELIKQKIKKGINKMNKELDDNKKSKIDYEIVDFLIDELKNFDINNFKHKNGKIVEYYEYNKSNYYIFKIHDNILEII